MCGERPVHNYRTDAWNIIHANVHTESSWKAEGRKYLKHVYGSNSIDNPTILAVSGNRPRTGLVPGELYQSPVADTPSQAAEAKALEVESGLMSSGFVVEDSRMPRNLIRDLEFGAFL